jgi:hypothetical protein
MSIATQVLKDAVVADPASPALQAASDVIATVADPSAANILQDIEHAIVLIQELKSRMNGLHPSVVNLIRALF